MDETALVKRKKTSCTEQGGDFVCFAGEVRLSPPESGGGSSVHVSRGVVCTRLPRGRLYTSTCFQVQ